MASLFAKVFIAALAAGTVSALPASSATYQPAEPTPAAPAPPAVNNDELIADLKVTSTSLKRFQKLLLADDGAILSGDALREKVVFDFGARAAAAPNAQGGKTAAANIDTHPILTELGISTTVAFLNPCGMNTPHIHPRATEWLTVVEGELDVGYILENGFAKKEGASNEVTAHLSKFQGAVFPMGSIHYQFNNNCKPATFVATLNKEDPGTSQIAQNFFGLNGEVVNVALGFPESIDGKNIEEFRGTIPANLAQAIDTCLKKCDGEY